MSGLRKSMWPTAYLEGKIQFEQEMSANYTSLAEQLHFRQMEMETIKKASPAGFPLQKVTLWDIFSRPQFGTRRGRVGRWS